MDSTENLNLVLEDTPPIEGQEGFVYTYVLAREPKDGLMGFIKVTRTFGDHNSMQEEYKRVESTNKNCRILWNDCGRWVPLRHPETDTEGTIDFVYDNEEEEFMGEKIPKNDVVAKEVIKDENKLNSLKDRCSMDNYKAMLMQRKNEERKLELRRQVMKELQEELDDPTTLASFSKLQWQRLAQKNAVAEAQVKLEEAQQSLTKTLKELRVRSAKYPHYKDKWQNEIRRIHKQMDPSHPERNPVDAKIANLGEEDDETLANVKLAEVSDEFDDGIGVEDPDRKKDKKTSTMIDNGNSENDKIEYEKVNSNVNNLKEELKDREDKIARSFLPDAPIKKMAPQGAKNKKKKKNKPKK